MQHSTLLASLGEGQISTQLSVLIQGLLLPWPGAEPPLIVSEGKLILQRKNKLMWKQQGKTAKYDTEMWKEDNLPEPSHNIQKIQNGRAE